MTFGFIAIALFVYFLPSLVAVLRRCKEANQIFVLDLYLGWTVIGWVTALQWALDLPRTKPGTALAPVLANDTGAPWHFSLPQSFRLIALIGVTAVFLYLSLFVLPGTPRLLRGDGFINFENARRMAAGERLYLDIFQYTLPGTELLELALIKIFSAKLAILNAMLLIAGVADLCLAISLASEVLSYWDAVLASILFLCFGYHCGLDATVRPFSVMFAYGAAAVIVSRRSPRRLACAGALLGLATCFSQSRAFVALGIAGFLVWENHLKPESERHLWRDASYLLAPFVVLLSLGCGYVIWSGGLQHFIRDVVTFPLFHHRHDIAGTWSTSFQDWLPAAGGIAEKVIIRLMVPGVYVGFLIYYWLTHRKDEPPPYQLILLTVVGLSLYAGVATAPRYVVVAGMSAPAFILAIWMLDRAAGVAWKTPAWGVAASFLLLAPLTIQWGQYWFFDSSAGPIAISSQGTFQELAWLSQHTRPGDEFFAASSPKMYVLLNLRNPARVPLVEADDFTRPRQVLKTLHALQQAKPEFILWPFQPDDADDPGDLLYPLGEELRDCYRPVRQFRDGELWQRKRHGCSDHEESFSRPELPS